MVVVGGCLGERLMNRFFGGVCLCVGWRIWDAGFWGVSR